MAMPGRGPAWVPASRRRRPTTTMVATAATSASFSFRLVYVYVLCNENPRTSPKCAEIYRVWPKFIVFGRILSCLSRTSPNFFYFKTCLGRPWGRRLGTNSPPGPIFAPAHPQAAILGAPWGANGWRCSKQDVKQEYNTSYPKKLSTAMIEQY